MMKSQRVLRLTAQVSLLVALASASDVRAGPARTSPTSDKVYRQGAVTEVVERGPVIDRPGASGKLGVARGLHTTGERREEEDRAGAAGRFGRDSRQDLRSLRWTA